MEHWPLVTLGYLVIFPTLTFPAQGAFMLVWAVALCDHNGAA